MALGRALSRDRRSSDRFDRFLAVLLLLVALGMVIFHSVLFTFVIAMIVAYLLHPFVGWLQRFRIPRWAGTMIAYVVLLGGLTGFVLHVIPKVEYEANKLILKLNVVLDDVPALVDSLKGSFDSVLSVLPGDSEEEAQASAWGSDASLAKNRSLGLLRPPVLPDERAFRAGLPGLHRRPGGEIDVVEVSSGHYRVRLRGEGLKITPAEGGYLVRAEEPGDLRESSADLGAGLSGFRERLAHSLQNGLISLSEELLSHVVAGAQNLVTGVLSIFFGIFVVLMAAAYTLIDAPSVMRYFVRAFPERRREDVSELLSLLDQGMRGVVRGQVFICLVNGLLSLIGFSFFIPDYALILGLVAGVLSFIPIFGTFISSVPAVLIGLSISLQTAFLVLGWILLIHFIEAYILNPKIIGREAHIHPVMVIVAVVAGERSFGISGAFLAVPTAAVLKAFIVFAYRRSDANGLRAKS